MFNRSRVARTTDEQFILYVQTFEVSKLFLYFVSLDFYIVDVS